jgi:hypothetical protein
MSKEISWQVKLKSEREVLGTFLWGLGIIMVATSFIWLLHNFLGGLAVLALGILYLRFYHQAPVEKKVILTDKGVQYGANLYYFADILSFAILKIRGKDFILFLTDSRNMPELVIELPKSLIKDEIIHFLNRELPRQTKLNIFSPFHLDSYLGI